MSSNDDGYDSFNYYGLYFKVFVYCNNISYCFIKILHSYIAYNIIYRFDIVETLFKLSENLISSFKV